MRTRCGAIVLLSACLGAAGATDATDAIGAAETSAAFLDAVTAQLSGARMVKFDMQCAGIEISGDWASEWCQEHQLVLVAQDKPPFDGRGVMLLVLHRGADGQWRLKREMWNPAAAADRPAADRAH